VIFGTIMPFQKGIIMLSASKGRRQKAESRMISSA